jgi:hypothetical protein
MQIQKFINTRPYLYHLTDKRNLDSILEHGVLYSTQELVRLAKYADAKKFLTSRRPDHVPIPFGNSIFYIRDQHPLSLTILSKCLDGCTIEEFIAYLNSKVFFWGRPQGLNSHYARYEKEGEKPVILRVSTQELVDLNSPAKFTHLNSGGPRASSHLGGKGSPRGLNTFKAHIEYNRGASSVNEVVFDKLCKLPETLYRGSHPDGPFKKI